MDEPNAPEPSNRGSGFPAMFAASAHLIDRFTMALNVVGTLIIVALMILICADVIGRSLFDLPISGVPELVSLSIVAIVFLQAGQAFKMGRMTRSEAFMNFLARRFPKIQAILEMAFSIAGIFVIAALFQSSLPLFQKAWIKGTFVGTIGDFIAPVWPVKLIILIGCTALLLQLILDLARQMIRLFTPTSADRDLYS